MVHLQKTPLCKALVTFPILSFLLLLPHPALRRGPLSNRTTGLVTSRLLGFPAGEDWRTPEFVVKQLSKFQMKNPTPSPLPLPSPSNLNPLLRTLLSYGLHRPMKWPYDPASDGAHLGSRHQQKPSQRPKKNSQIKGKPKQNSQKSIEMLLEE